MLYTRGERRGGKKQNENEKQVGKLNKKDDNLAQNFNKY